MSLPLQLVGLLPTRLIKQVSALQWRYPVLQPLFELAADRFRRQDGVIQQGVARGLRFNTGNSVAGFMLGTSEPQMQRAFELFVKPGMCVFDVGSNVGFYSVLSARLVGPTGRVVAVEPLPSNVQQIGHNVELNGFGWVTVLELALGAADGTADFVVSSNTNWGRLATVAADPAAPVAIKPVRVARLDTLVATGEVLAPDVVKIDIEGAENDALDGAKDVLATKRPVLLIDLHNTNAGVASHLAAAGYEARAIGCGNRSLTDVAWSAEVVAVPRERADLMPALETMSAMRS